MPPKKKLRTEASWEFDIDGGKWTLYDATDAAMLEKEYITRKSVGSFETTNFTFNAGYGTKYTIDFDKMTQLNQQSGKHRNIRRVAPCSEISWEYKDDSDLFVQFYEADTNEIESLYCDNGLNAPTKTKKLSWNKGYNSMYTFVFTSETKGGPGGTSVVEVLGTQKNEDSGKVRHLRRTFKKAPWAVEGYGISGDKDALAKLQLAAAAAAATVAPTATSGGGAVEGAATVAPTTAAAAPAVPTTSAVATAAPAAPVGVSLASMIKTPTLSLPNYWQNAKLFDAVGGHHEVKLDPTTEEFKFIADLHLKSIGKKVNIVHIVRLENAAMYTFYAMTRMVIANGESMLAANCGGKGNVGAANEKFLFTGERVGTNMLAIKKFGFDTRVAPANGSYGQGLYFGAKASFADNGRCIQNSDGSKDMFVCRVTVGNAAKGANGFRRPPPLDPKKPTMALYDSCVDDVADPQIFVIFNSKQAYPEYIVRYI